MWSESSDGYFYKCVYVNERETESDFDSVISNIIKFIEKHCVNVGEPLMDFSHIIRIEESNGNFRLGIAEISYNNYVERLDMLSDMDFYIHIYVETRPSRKYGNKYFVSRRKRVEMTFYSAKDDKDSLSFVDDIFGLLYPGQHNVGFFRNLHCKIIDAIDIIRMISEPLLLRISKPVLKTSNYHQKWLIDNEEMSKQLVFSNFNYNFDLYHFLDIFKETFNFYGNDAKITITDTEGHIHNGNVTVLKKTQHTVITANEISDFQIIIRTTEPTDMSCYQQHNIYAVNVMFTAKTDILLREAFDALINSVISAYGEHMAVKKYNYIY